MMAWAHYFSPYTLRENLKQIKEGKDNTVVWHPLLKSYTSLILHLKYK